MNEQPPTTGNFSDDGWIKLWSIAEYHWESFFFAIKSSICFFFGFPAYLVSGTWSPKQCQILASSHRVGINSNHILVGYS